MKPRIPNGFWALAILVLWGLGVVALLDRSPYGLDEATARAVLVLWSASDHVAAPVVTLSVPDFRALFLLPAGILFSGSLVAAKLATLLYLVAAVLLLFLRRRAQGDAETPLLASGLLLLSPLAINAIDRIAVGPYLLVTFLAGAWADESYRTHRLRFGGFFFAQLLFSIAAITLHPAGLAYPLVLLWSWLRNPPPEPQARSVIPGRERTHVLIGLVVAMLLGLALAWGWPLQHWLANPVRALGADVFAFPRENLSMGATPWLRGALVAAALAAVVIGVRRSLREDRFAATLVVAAAIGLATGDSTFALVVFVLILYWGFPQLLRVHLGHAQGLATGFASQRGMAFAALLVLSTAFLVIDRGHYSNQRLGLQTLSPHDQLISALSDAVQAEQAKREKERRPGVMTAVDRAKASVKVASQWPGRTMIACGCSTLPLPPASRDLRAFAANLHGLDYVIFDPRTPQNRPLSQDFAMLGGSNSTTVALQEGGVVLRLAAARTQGAPAPVAPAPAKAPGGAASASALPKPADSGAKPAAGPAATSSSKK